MWTSKEDRDVKGQRRVVKHTVSADELLWLFCLLLSL